MLLKHLPKLILLLAVFFVPLGCSTTPVVPKAPTVSSVTPNSGSTGGGTAVVITGTGFAAGSTVTIGGSAATAVSVAGTTSINATTPAHAAGSVDVTVGSAGLTGSLTGGFTYVAPVTLAKEDWQVDFTYLGGSYRLEVFFTQTGDDLSGSNFDGIAERNVVTSGKVSGSSVVVTFTLSQGGSSRGNVTCTGTVSSGAPQTITGTFTSPSNEAVGGTSGTCNFS